MKNKIEIGDSVPGGTVKEIATFTDHVEFLVEKKDGTASWVHESNLKPSTTK